jgi:hypothetical protein
MREGIKKQNSRVWIPETISGGVFEMKTENPEYLEIPI